MVCGGLLCASHLMQFSNDSLLIACAVSLHEMVQVTDFGTSRKFRPSDPVLLTSAFTGVTRRVSMVPGRIDDDKGWTETATETASVGAGDLSTTLTGAVGTLLWQAPELFRGDRHYTNSVDVYSYGIILYEIATRRLPWVGEIDDDDYMSTVRWLEAALKADRRPALPSEMEAHHPEFVDVMRQCWAGDPGERPSFSSVVAILRGVQGVEAPHGEPSVTPGSATSRNMQPSCEGSLSQPLLREPW
jgi:serine/threonine protein kinase